MVKAMSVGGQIIEIRYMHTPDGLPSSHVIRFWVIDRDGNEACVYAEPQDDLPKIGDKIWWQAGKIFYDNDKKTLRKVGYSFSAPTARG